MITNPVGRKVNLLVAKGICSWEMSDEVCEVISVVPWTKELNDWCEHYIVRKPDGSEVEVRECDCVFSPDAEKEGVSRIHQFLYDNGVYGEVWSAIGGDNVNAVYVSISWGDWKHEHLWARDLMSYLGYVQVGVVVTEEDGSDCYSAEHTYVKSV